MEEVRTESKSYKWVMLGLLAVTYFLMHSARQVFNASLPQIKADLAGHGATDAQLGLSRTIFLLAYGLMVPFAGIAADFFKRKWVIVVGVLFFSTSVFFTGYAESMLMLFVFYGLLNGIGQCMIPGAAGSLIAQYHVETRSTALSIYQSALYVGTLTSSVTAGYLSGASESGWRMSFWIFGGIAVLWAGLLAVFLRNTPPIVCATAESRAPGDRATAESRAPSGGRLSQSSGKSSGGRLSESSDKPSFREALRAFSSKPSAWLITFAFGMLVFGSNCFRTWMPAFMQQRTDWGLTPGSAAFHSVFWFFAGSFIGIAIGARISDRCSASRPGIRLSVMAFGLAAAAPAMALMVLVPSLWLSCVMMFVFGLASGFFDCNLYAGLYDVVAPRYRSAAMGMYLCGAFILGCPATWVLGWVGHHYSLKAGIAIFAATYALGALAMFIARGVFYDRDKEALV